MNNDLPSTRERFRRLFGRPAGKIVLAEAALLIAAEEYRGLDVTHYLGVIDAMGASLGRRLRQDIPPTEAVVALNHFLFDECGFRGNAADYYDPRNSFLNEVLERKLGIPITLSILYIEIGRRVGLPLHGVSFPGHFLVSCEVRDGTIVLDPFARGRSLSVSELKRRVRELRSGIEPSERALAVMLAVATNKEIIARLLRNLKGIYLQRGEQVKALSAADRILMITPEVAEEYRERGTIYLELECCRAALEDFQRYLALAPDARDAQLIRQRIAALELQAARLN